MDPATLRPLGIGEILDTAITIYRQRAATMMKAVLIVVAPVQVLTAIVTLSGGDGEAFVDERSFEPGVVDTTIDWTALIGFIAVIIGVSILGFLATQLATAANLKVVSGAYLGSEPDWRESLQFARQHLGPLIWLSIVYFLGLGVGFLLCIAPAVYLYAAWAVATPVLLLEERRGAKALGRSRQLVKGRWGPTFLVILVGTILASIVTAALQGLLVGVVLSGANDIVQAVANAIAGTVSTALVTPFTAAVSVVLYFDLRVRKEGFDLELLAQRVGIEPPEGTTFASSPLPPARPTGNDDDPPFWPPPPGWRPRA